MIRALAIAAALAGCYRPTPPTGAPCDELAPCPTGQACVNGTCDGSELDAPILIVDAPLDTMIDAPDADPNCTLVDECMGDMVVGCNPPVTCAWGCVAIGDAHCARLDPSNGIAWALVPANPATLTLTDAGDPWTLDTDTGVLTNAAGTVTLPAGTTSVVSGPYRVLAAGAIVVEANANLVVTGTRPLVLLAEDRITIGTNAVVDLDAGCRNAIYDPTCGGAGGGRGALATTAATGCGPGQNGGEDVFMAAGEGGGGGGGMATEGGNGGGTAAGQGIPGIKCGTPTNVPLRGGSGGGAGGERMPMVEIIGGRGGGGGGAIQLSAGNAITIAGVISANGAGGETGHVTSLSFGGGGGGGGAGGGVLLEAGRVDVTGTVAANGGGGGGNSLPGAGSHGTSGQRSSMCAPGGIENAGWRGGDGGCRATPPESTVGVGVADDRGGGGGAAGWITIARTIGTTTGVVSPAPTLGTPDFD